MYHLMGIIIVLVMVPAVFAQGEMTSPEYKLRLEQIDASKEASLRSIRPETQLKLRDDGYFIAAVNEQPLTFTISTTVVEISEDQETKVYMSARSERTYNYQISAMAWTPLQSVNGDQIPETECDREKERCTPWRTGTWATDSAPGWGYHLSGPDIVPGFTKMTSYRPLSMQDRVSLATQTHTEGERASQMSFKVQTNPTDTNTYTSIIQLLAISSL